MCSHQGSNGQYRVTRRTVLQVASRAAYGVPLVTATFRLDQLTAMSVDNKISIPSTDLIPTKNEAPIAIAGDGFEVVDSDGDGFELVSVDGSKSSDPEGAIASFVWTFDGQVISEEATASVSLPIGTHRLLLTVTDKEGASSEAKIRIRVKEGEPLSQVVEPAAPPPAPFDVKVVQEKAELVLTWQEPADTPKPIRVYRVVDDGLIRPIEERDWLLLVEEWEKLEYRDKTPLVGQPVFYVLRSFDGVNESDWSNVVSATAAEYVEDDQPEPEESDAVATEVPPAPTDEPAEAPPPVPTDTQEIPDEAPTDPPADEPVESTAESAPDA